jgi:hypothetical protein
LITSNNEEAIYVHFEMDFKLCKKHQISEEKKTNNELWRIFLATNKQSGG